MKKIMKLKVFILFTLAVGISAVWWLNMGQKDFEDDQSLDTNEDQSSYSKSRDKKISSKNVSLESSSESAKNELGIIKSGKLKLSKESTKYASSHNKSDKLSMVHKQAILPKAKAPKSWKETNLRVEGLKKTQLHAIPVELEALMDESISYDEKLTLVHSLGDNLPLKSRESLYAYIVNAKDTSLSLHIKDEALIVLDRQSENLELHVESMKEMVKAKDLDGELRGYMTQHLASSYSELSHSAQSKLVDFLMIATEDHGTDVSGTALLGLTKIEKENEGAVDMEIVKEKAENILTSDNVHRTSYVTALSLSGPLGLRGAVDILEEEAVNGEHSSLKAAAIYSLGELGDESHINVLNNLHSDEEGEYLKPAIELALNKIGKRSH
ncbi:MAG: hypothetical protein HQL32_01320 [Planctomycetes bacterium]|nr:hypothetical protein [Planctomycetota bacterium]